MPERRSVSINRPTRANAADDDIHLPIGIFPDFFSRRLAVNLGVGGILKMPPRPVAFIVYLDTIVRYETNFCCFPECFGRVAQAHRHWRIPARSGIATRNVGSGNGCEPVTGPRRTGEA